MKIEVERNFWSSMLMYTKLPNKQYMQSEKKYISCIVRVDNKIYSVTTHRFFATMIWELLCVENDIFGN